jgi:uncharacterized coiled-coil protein SlyX
VASKENEMSDQETIQKLNEELAKTQVHAKEQEDQIAALNKRLEANSPEAIYSITIDRTGGAMITVRSIPGESGDSFLSRLTKMREKVAALGLNTKPQAAVFETPTSGTPPPVATAPKETESEGGTAHAVLLKIGKAFTSGKPQLQFTCEGMEHPLSFTKSASEMLKLLAPIGAYTADHLVEGKIYPMDCLIDWKLGEPGKDDKRYRNIVKVHPK